jgi:FkbM family methyltransferase
MKKILKKVYGAVPFKQQIFSLLKKVYVPEENMYQHLHFKGIFELPVTATRSLKMHHYGFQLENDLFWKGLTGKWEKKSIELWMELSRNSKVILDIGANTGIYALVSKTLNPEAKVLAFEPVKRVFEKLKANISLNNYAITPYPYAVSDHCGEATFYDTDEDHTYSITIGKDLSQDNRYHPVQVTITTIDDIAREGALETIDLIKIDVESHEPEVLKGFSGVSKYQPAILIEILSDEVGSRVQKELENYGAPYLYFDINEEKGVTWVEHITKSTGMNYLLCTEETAKGLRLL